MYSSLPSGHYPRSAEPGIQEKLEQLADDPDMDDETVELIDSAIENLVFNNSLEISIYWILNPNRMKITGHG